MNDWHSLFKDWLKANRTLSDSSLGHYSGAIKSILSWLGKDFSDIPSYDEFLKFKTEVLANPFFVQRNTTGKNMYSMALNHFEEFVKSIASSDSFIYPEVVHNEAVPDTNLLEGAKKTVTINAYERNPQARKQCIQHHGDSCVVCGFRFADVFGEGCEGVIHVHHLKPLSEMTKEYLVDPIHDLVPVCPNCHLVIHRKQGGTYTISEVQAMRKR